MHQAPLRFAPALMRDLVAEDPFLRSLFVRRPADAGQDAYLRVLFAIEVLDNRYLERRYEALAAGRPMAETVP